MREPASPGEEGSRFAVCSSSDHQRAPQGLYVSLKARWRTAERLELEKRKGGGKEKEASEPADSPGSSKSESCCGGGQPSVWNYGRGRKNEEEASQLSCSLGSAESESCTQRVTDCHAAARSPLPPQEWKGENKAKGSEIKGEDSSCCSPAPAWRPSPRRWSSLNFLSHESFLRAVALPELLLRGSLLRIAVLSATKYNGGGGFPQTPSILLQEQPPAPASGFPPRAAGSPSSMLARRHGHCGYLAWT
ncbi:uncharacterized protein LOC122153806 [Tyto alba]|uniref:uncharacterized protein LOC122153806 n=1 Tax=Tyto alba TaxID=56313 RepID=UPI001C678F8A|nr:uncharacterized protein LOC122153806 [Tyto alba]